MPDMKNTEVGQSGAWEDFGSNKQSITEMSPDQKDGKDGQSDARGDVGSGKPPEMPPVKKDKKPKKKLTGMPDRNDTKDGKNRTWKDVGWFALKTTAISGVLVGGIVLALPLIGFTAGGVAAGSIAGVKSAYLATGSAYAVMQSAGVAVVTSTEAAVVSSVVVSSVVVVSRTVVG